MDMREQLRQAAVRGLALACMLIAGCAVDPRIETLREESGRLQQQVAQGKLTEAQAQRQLDARTVELFGPGHTFCETAYSPMLGSYEGPPVTMYDPSIYPYVHHYRPFPNCDIVELQHPRLPDAQPGASMKK